MQLVGQLGIASQQFQSFLVLALEDLLRLDAGGFGRLFKRLIVQARRQIFPQPIGIVPLNQELPDIFRHFRFPVHAADSIRRGIDDVMQLNRHAGVWMGVEKAGERTLSRLAVRAKGHDEEIDLSRFGRLAEEQESRRNMQAPLADLIPMLHGH